jgi:hypothetical protein
MRTVKDETCPHVSSCTCIVAVAECAAVIKSVAFFRFGPRIVCGGIRGSDVLKVLRAERAMLMHRPATVDRARARDGVDGNLQSHEPLAAGRRSCTTSRRGQLRSERIGCYVNGRGSLPGLGATRWWVEQRLHQLVASLRTPASHYYEHYCCRGHDDQRSTACDHDNDRKVVELPRRRWFARAGASGRRRRRRGRHGAATDLRHVAQHRARNKQTPAYVHRPNITPRAL